MDELTQRRFARKRQARMPTPPKGSLSLILEDLSIVEGMVVEMRAEAKACEPEAVDVDIALVKLDDALTSAIAVTMKARGK